MIAETAFGDWGPLISLLALIVQVVFSVVISIVGWLLKRQVDQNDQAIKGLGDRVAAVEAASGEVNVNSILADGAIRERLAASYVSKTDCVTCSQESRETTTRLFGKIERLQEGQAAIGAKIDLLIGGKPR